MITGSVVLFIASCILFIVAASQVVRRLQNADAGGTHYANKIDLEFEIVPTDGIRLPTDRSGDFGTSRF